MILVFIIEAASNKLARQGSTIRRASEVDVNTAATDRGNMLLEELTSTGKTRLRRVGDSSKAMLHFCENSLV